MSIATIPLRGDLVERLQGIASANFEGVEMFDNDLFSGQPRRLRSLEYGSR